MLQKHPAVKLAVLFLAFMISIQTGCKKSDSITDPGPTLEPPVKADDAIKVTATITGTVIDENNKPVAGATVSSGTYAATTDAMGNFIIKDANISKANGNVSVVKQGYFKGIRSFVTVAGKNNYIKIQLIKQIVTGTVTASSGGVVNTLDGASITFPANAFVTQSGAAFSGTVFVYAYWIDPTANNLPLIMPGDLRGVDSSNGEYILKSYGMLGAELKDNAGNILKIATGKTATVSFPIPSSLLATAPQSIPLWHFDETVARWKQEGTATKSGNNYIGQVDKFSFWNCDIPGNLINLDLRLVNSANNLPLANTMVKITSLSTNTSAYGYTNDSGFVSGPVPKNQALKMDVIAGTACATNTVIYTQNIGPYTANTSLGNVSVTVPVNQTINFTATLVNCSNQPVTNGYISLILSNGNSTIAYTNASGAINISLPYCGGSTSYTYTGVDLSNGNYSAIATGTATGNNVNLGTLTACGNTINVNGVYIAGSIDNNAVLWKDGVPQLLTNISANQFNHYAYALETIIYNNDVYVFGEEDDSTIANGWTGVLKIWKNGVATNITSGTTEVYGRAFDIYNGDIYVTGSETINNTDFLKVWKNGVGTVLTKDTFDYGLVNDIKVINGDVYICGYLTKLSPSGNYTSGNITRPVYWKNGVITILSNTSHYSEAKGVFSYNGDVYFTGSDTSLPVYWKNGLRNVFSIPSPYIAGETNKIFIDNGDIYAAGEVSQLIQTTGGSYTHSNLLYWKNNTSNILTNYSASPTAPYIELSDIYVKNNIVYTIGNRESSPFSYYYFQNSVPVPLSGFTSSQDVWVYSIFVK